MPPSIDPLIVPVQYRYLEVILVLCDIGAVFAALDCAVLDGVGPNPAEAQSPISEAV